MFPCMARLCDRFKIPILYTVQRCAGIQAPERPRLIRKELHNDEKTVRLILNAERRNSISQELTRQLHKELHTLNTCPTVRAIIIAADGLVFSAGHDLREMVQTDIISKHREIFLSFLNLVSFIPTMEVPVIAEVRGLAGAAGCQLVASCDLVVAGRNSLFSTPGAKIGLFCHTPLVATSRYLPRKVALDMLLTAEPINAKKAQEFGLVSRIVDDDQVTKEALDVACKISSFSRSVITNGKKFFYAQLELPMNEAYRTAIRAMSENLRLADAQLGISAFLEKRRAHWTHTDNKMF